ncbi:hypothetical protein LTR17_005803 [Elasticomyces elasticus]|nr:hypothetical protein LTR17_005803 [Elasticomyces elasticus]
MDDLPTLPPSLPPQQHADDDEQAASIDALVDAMSALQISLPPLLRLAPELRNAIYDYLRVPTHTDVTLTATVYRDCQTGHYSIAFTTHASPVSSVCSMLRDEFPTDLYYSTNVFLFTPVFTDTRVLDPFIEGRRHAVSKIKSIKIHTELVISGVMGMRRQIGTPPIVSILKLDAADDGTVTVHHGIDPNDAAFVNADSICCCDITDIASYGTGAYGGSLMELVSYLLHNTNDFAAYPGVPETCDRCGQYKASVPEPPKASRKNRKQKTKKGRGAKMDWSQRLQKGF